CKDTNFEGEKFSNKSQITSSKSQIIFKLKNFSFQIGIWNLRFELWNFKYLPLSAQKKKNYISMLRWLLAVLGYALYRFPGAILGIVIVSYIDKFIVNAKTYQTSFGTSQQDVTPADFELNLRS